MTKRKNMTKGERFELVEKKVSNLEMTQRVHGMMVQQIGNAVSPMAQDVGELAGRQRELQYRLLAAQELLGLKLEDLNKRAEELQVRDFNDTSDKEDVELGYTVTDVVGEDSVVILTSTVADSPEKSILRSKLVFRDIGFPDLRKDLLGKKVGDVLTADVNGTKHAVTLLGIRTVPAKAEEVVETTAETVN